MRTLKRIAVFILAAVLFASLSLSLVSCSTRLSGTYETSSSTSSTSSSNMLKTTYVFDGKRVTKSQSITLSSSTTPYGETLTGTYDISYKGWNDGYEITFVWDAVGSYANKSEADRTETYSFEKTSTYIRIDGVGYTKVQTEESHEGHNH